MRCALEVRDAQVFLAFALLARSCANSCGNLSEETWRPRRTRSPVSTPARSQMGSVNSRNQRESFHFFRLRRPRSNPFTVPSTVVVRCNFHDATASLGTTMKRGSFGCLRSIVAVSLMGGSIAIRIIRRECGRSNRFSDRWLPVNLRQADAVPEARGTNNGKKRTLQTQFFRSRLGARKKKWDASDQLMLPASSAMAISSGSMTSTLTRLRPWARISSSVAAW